MSRTGTIRDVSTTSEQVTERTLHKEVTVGTSIETVWRAWTTSDGMATWWAERSWIDLRVGGPYELYFRLDQPRGSQGTESCRILSYLPQEMLSFSWNFPPEIPEIRFEHTWVVLRLQRVGPHVTRVILDQLGWGAGSAWDAGWKYFDEAWGDVLDRLRTRLPTVDRDGPAGG
jgi:uncharacterized protein YndB with AHSA1/START domain